MRPPRSRAMQARATTLPFNCMRADLTVSGRRLGPVPLLATVLGFFDFSDSQDHIPTTKWIQILRNLKRKVKK